MSSGCQFDIAWVGKCGKPTTSASSSRCVQHRDVMCSRCGDLAELSCEVTLGAFVCGIDLCKTCYPIHKKTECGRYDTYVKKPQPDKDSSKDTTQESNKVKKKDDRQEDHDDVEKTRTTTRSKKKKTRKPTMDDYIAVSYTHLTLPTKA